MIETAEDRRALLQDDGEQALFANVPSFDTDGNADVIVSREVLCLFDRGAYEEGGRIGYHPLALILDEDAIYLQSDQRLMLKGQVWEIDTPMPDGTGYTQLHLHRVARYQFAADDPRKSIRYPYTVETYLDFSPGQINF